jgi:tetratricopeptide (TPR) repeat protein
MSILDGLPTSEAELKTAIEIAEPYVQKMFDDLNLPPAAKQAVELMKEGLSLADIAGITKQQRDALLAQGGHLLQLGEVGKARDVFIQLYKLEPSDERTVYALATTYQIEGDFATAAKLYVLFMALDGTNPEGPLRLGECLLGAKEYEKAEGFFVVAEKFAEHARDAACKQHAVKMIEITRERRAAAAS